MVGLIDIAPATEKVAGVSVYGVSARGIVHLITEFPELRKLMSGMDVDQDTLVKMAPNAVAAIIAAGCGFPGDKTQEEEASRLSIDMQADFLAAIIRLTMPRGVVPFVQKLASLGVRLNVQGDQSTTAPATKSRKASKA